MHDALQRLYSRLRTGFWFLPTLMLLAAAALALLLLHVDRHLDPGTRSTVEWAYSGGPEGARSLLSTVAGSMITAASVTFSLASVALSIASQQYGSRVLRNFMRDRVTQSLLGVFLATFVYCVLVVRTIRGSDFSGGFVPAISITGGTLLAFASLVLLIYFIHHVSASIQASQIVRVIATNTQAAIPELYPGSAGEAACDTAGIEAARLRGGATVRCSKDGYVQTIALDKLLACAASMDGVIELLTKPGDHLVGGATLARVWGVAKLSDEECAKLRGAFHIDMERTPDQDIRYQFQQLTDVIVRALSPGINDPFTAINGIDVLASTATQLARRERVQIERKDESGTLRLVAPVADLSEILDKTVGHIAIYAAGDRFVTASLRRVLDLVEAEVTSQQTLHTVAALRSDLNRREEAKAA